MKGRYCGFHRRVRHLAWEAALPGDRPASTGRGLGWSDRDKGHRGLRAKSHLHTSRLLRLSEDLPLIIEVVDTAEHIERALPLLDGMIDDGLMTLEQVHVFMYRAGSAAQGGSPPV